MSHHPWYEQYIVRDPEILSGTPALVHTHPCGCDCGFGEPGIDQVKAALPSINAVQLPEIVHIYEDRARCVSRI